MKLCKVIPESMICSYGTVQNHFFSLLFVSLYVESIIIFCFYIYIYICRFNFYLHFRDIDGGFTKHGK